MKASTQKLTTAAVCTALAVIMCAMTAYLPLSFMPLFLAAFCIFLACKRGSLAYGILTMLATVGLMFLMAGLSVKWLALVLVFAPYSLLAYFMHRFGYFKLRTGLIRGAVMLLYFNVTVGIVYVIALRVAGIGIEGLDLVEWSNRLGGYALLAIIATVVLMPLDFIFSTLSVVVLKKIPSPVTRLKKPQASAGASEDNGEQDKYDIFGYELHPQEQKGEKGSDEKNDGNE